MTINFGAISHATGGLVFLLISLLLARGRFRRLVDRSLLLACLLTATWLFVVAAQQAFGTPSFSTRYISEILKNAGWISVLYVVLGIHLSPYRVADRTRYFLAIATSSILILMLMAGMAYALLQVRLISGNWLAFLQVLISVSGLVMVEQVWRNEVTYKRSNLRYLCLGIGALFTYDFILYSDALLFSEISSSLWDSRGIITTLCAPLIAFTMINTARQPIEVQVSRQLVFHSSLLLMAGLYLLLISAAGYYINRIGGDWSEAFLVIFFFCALLSLAFLGTSPRLRARLLVFISQNFFNYKYDYREEWQRVTRNISGPDDISPIEQRTVQALAYLVGSRHGILWLRDEDNNFVAKGYWNTSEIKQNKIDINSDLVQFLSRSDWIINLKEYQEDPTQYDLMEIPDCLFRMEAPWLIVPMQVNEQLFGIVCLGEPLTRMALNWENYDLIKIVSRQITGYLALQYTETRLSEVRQFEAVNRASAFMVHDLKTIVAQLSLLANNAEKHKHNPAFVDDMINTTRHAIDKMNKLLTQIRKPVTQDHPTRFSLDKLLEDVMKEKNKREPAPGIVGELPSVEILADRDKLKDVLSHLIQNAQDATPREGEVGISIKRSAGWVVIFIQDSGEGMSEEFIKNQLFKPFESTKGLTGMGIGAYQSREYVRKLGGSLEVTSEPGLGTCFTIKIPLESANNGGNGNGRPRLLQNTG